MSYGDMFNLQMLEGIASSLRDTVVTYPAGTGKTMAIYNYIIKHWKDGRKIIYIAPTISLIEDLYERLKGDWNLSIFKFHSKSEDLARIKKESGGDKILEQRIIQDRIKGANVILITHKRMMFEPPTRFLDDMLTSTLSDEEKTGICFIDEAVEPCVIASISRPMVLYWLTRAKLIDPSTTQIPKFAEMNYLTGELEPTTDMSITVIARSIYSQFSGLRIGPNKRLPRPSELSIDLSQKCGFENKGYDPIIDRRLESLYQLLSLQIAKGAFLDDNTKDSIYMEIPVALHSTWHNFPYSQCIVMDATANLTRAVYKDYQKCEAPEKGWNYSKLTNYVIHGPQFSKTNMEKSMENEVSNYEQVLNKMTNLKAFKKIYIVCPVDFLERMANYLKSKFNDYKIVFSVADAEDLEDDPDTDHRTDEGYEGITDEKVIYLSNYGRTRGSNIFRECECVIQIGAYRLPEPVMKRIKTVYPGLLTDDLPLANFVQELYRGRIRCDKPMVTVSIMDDHLFKAINERLPRFKIIDKSSLFEDLKTRRMPKARKELIDVYRKFLYKAQQGECEISFETVMAMLGQDDRNNCVRTMRRIFRYDEFEDLFLNREEFGKGRSLILKNLSASP